MSVCLSPSNAIFLKCWSQNGLDVECDCLVILMNSGECTHHYLLIFSYFNQIIELTYLVSISWAILLHSPRLDFSNLHRTEGLSHALLPTTLHVNALHCNTLHFTSLHWTALLHWCTTLHCTALHCTALHCTALHCTALHCTELHCTALH